MAFQVCTLRYAEKSKSENQDLGFMFVFQAARWRNKWHTVCVQHRSAVLKQRETARDLIYEIDGPRANRKYRERTRGDLCPAGVHD